MVRRGMYRKVMGEEVEIEGQIVRYLLG